MATQPSIPDLVAAGAARVPASTVVRGGRLVNVVSAEVYPADVAVYGNTVVAIGDVSAHIGDDTRIVEAEGRHLVPGLFDGHQHLECSKLSITSAAKMLVPLGTLNVVSGLDQILVVAGLGRGPGLPARVPAHPIEGPVGRAVQDALHPAHLHGRPLLRPRRPSGSPALAGVRGRVGDRPRVRRHRRPRRA